MEETFFYEIDYSLLPVKGDRLGTFRLLGGSSFSEKYLEARYCPIFLVFSNENQETSFTLKITGVGQEDSVFGDLYAMELERIVVNKKSVDSLRLSQTMHRELVDCAIARELTIDTVYVFGQNIRPEQLDTWSELFRDKPVTIDERILLKNGIQTIVLIAFRLKNNKWVYISSYGLGGIRINLNEEQIPKEYFLAPKMEGTMYKCLYATQYDEFADIHNAP
jgi:hypothetical protein